MIYHAKRGHLYELAEKLSQQEVPKEELAELLAAATRKRRPNVVRWLLEKFPALATLESAGRALLMGAETLDGELVAWISGLCPVDCSFAAMAFADICDHGDLATAEKMLKELRVVIPRSGWNKEWEIQEEPRPLNKIDAHQAFFASAEACELRSIRWLIDTFGFNFDDDCELIVESLGIMSSQGGREKGLKSAQQLAEWLGVGDGRLSDWITGIVVSDLEMLHGYGYSEAERWLAAKFRITAADKKQFATPDRREVWQSTEDEPPEPSECAQS